MALAGCSADALSSTKTSYEEFLADTARLAAVQEQLAAEGISEEQRQVLQIMEKTFKTYAGGGDTRVAEYKAKLNQASGQAVEGARCVSCGQQWAAAARPGRFRGTASTPWAAKVMAGPHSARRTSNPPCPLTAPLAPGRGGAAAAPQRHGAGVGGPHNWRAHQGLLSAGVRAGCS